VATGSRLLFFWRADVAAKTGLKGAGSRDKSFPNRLVFPPVHKTKPACALFGMDSVNATAAPDFRGAATLPVLIRGRIFKTSRL